MPDWDADSPPLRRNLDALLRQIHKAANKREFIDMDTIRQWHRLAMQDLTVPDPDMIGKFRGEEGLEAIEVRIGAHLGIPAKEIAHATAGFERILQRVIGRLDKTIFPNADLGTDELSAVLDVCAWAHSEWVRIHPFANGNGRMARLLVNSLAMRYGLPPFLRLRPRPDGSYVKASEAAMSSDWHPTYLLFCQMLNETLESGT